MKLIVVTKYLQLGVLIANNEVTSASNETLNVAEKILHTAFPRSNENAEHLG